MLENVLFIPDFKYNLLSVSKITRELNCFVSFYPGFCLFQDLTSGTLKGIGKESDGLYIIFSPPHYVHSNISTGEIHRVNVAQKRQEDILLWHRRLAHPFCVSMKHLLCYKLNECKSIDCAVFPLAKHTRISFHHSTSTSVAVFELLHLDVWGTYHAETFVGINIFCLLLMNSLILPRFFCYCLRVMLY